MVKRLIKMSLIRCIYYIGFLFPSKIDKNTEVFLRLDNIGDFLLWLPTMQDYCKLNPKKKIILVCPENDAILARKYLHLEKIITCNKDNVYLITKSIKQFIKTTFTLSTLKCNKLIVPVYSRTIEISIAAYLIKAKEKIAIDGDATGMKEVLNSKCNLIYNRLITTSRETVHELNRNAEFMSKVSGHTIPVRVSNLEDNNERKISKKYFVISPGGSIRLKCWGVYKYLELAILLQNEYGYTCVLCGDASDQDLAVPFIENKEIQVINLINKTTLDDLISVIQYAEFFIGNDSVGIHIAASVQTESFCLFHGAYYGRFLPYSVENKIHIIYYKKCCYGCSLGISGQDFLTSECKNNLLNEGCYLCLSELTCKETFECIINILN